MWVHPRPLGVPMADVRRVALTLIRSGVKIRLVSPFVSARADRPSMVQVGSLREGEPYGSTTLRAAPYSAAEVQSAARFPLP
jgi:hypothetical protein